MQELKKIELELLEWNLFYNSVLGVLAFTFALACLSIPKYIALIACTASFVMIGAVGDTCKNKFSSSLKVLRSKENKTEYEQEILNFAETQFFENKRYMPFNIGMGALALTWLYTFYPVLIVIFPFSKWLT